METVGSSNDLISAVVFHFPLFEVTDTIVVFPLTTCLPVLVIIFVVTTFPLGSFSRLFFFFGTTTSIDDDDGRLKPEALFL